MMSSLSRELSLINHRSYEPIYSAKLSKNKLLQKRPYTSTNNTDKISNEVNKNKNHNLRDSVSRSALSTRSSNLTISSSVKRTETKSLTIINNKRKSQILTNDYNKQYENEDDNMTNISLLTVTSHEPIKLEKKYDSFQTFSHFERYMNRRSKVKLQPHLSPKLPVELEDAPEPTLFDLLDEDELTRLYDMFKVEKSIPFKIRSKSVCCDRISYTRQLIKRSIKMKRINSIERFVNIESNKYYHESYEINENNSQMKISEIIMNPDDSFDSNNNQLDFNGRSIKGPKIYEMGSNLLSVRSAKIENLLDKKVVENCVQSKINNQINRFSKPYSNVKSKLSAYFLANENKSADSLVNYSISALDQHKQTFKPYLKYQNRIIEKKSCIKMSDILENKIRENLKMNKGPVYYGEFTEENIKLHDLNHSENGKINLKEKFYNLYEWLNKIDIDECSHFYSNPFKQDKANLTDDCDLNQNLDFDIKLNNNQIKLSKIDPFENPKNITERFLPKRHDRFLFGFNAYYDTLDKKTHIAKKDYRTFLNLEPNVFSKFNSNTINLREKSDFTINNNNNNNSIGKSPTSEQTRSNLKKQRIINDSYLTRMSLDVYIL